MAEEAPLEEKISDIYSGVKNEPIQLPKKEEDENANKQLVKIYNWGEQNLGKIFSLLAGIAFLIGVYYVYFNNVQKDLNVLKEDIKLIKKELKQISINKNDIDNMQYRIESLKKVNQLQIRLQNIENKNK